MKKPKSKMDTACRRGVTWRSLPILLMLTLLVALLPTIAFAAWDGQGDVGDSGSSSVVGGFALPYANTNDILGYRFSVYSGTAAEKKGYSVDIDRKAHGLGTLYRAYGTTKMGHIELYDAYKYDPEVVEVGNMTSTEGATSNLVYRDTTLPATPSEVGTWLDPEKAAEIAVYYCEATTYNYETDYLVVEPLIMAKLEGDYYAMTIAEYAVYQSYLYGWTSLGDKDAGVEGTYRYNLMRAISGWCTRYLYAVEKYPILGTTPVPWSALKDDANGTPSILLSGSTRYNTAENMLKYQVGMGIYSGVKPTNQYTLTVNPDGGTWNGSTSTQTFKLVTDQTMAIPVPTRSGYTFSGWTVSGGGTLSSKTAAATYTQGSSNCTITATWTANAPSTYTNTIAFYAGEFKNQEGNSSTKNWLSMGSTTFTADAGSSVTMNSTRSITVPNGHYLANTFGTSDLSGSWTRYTMPYTFTQPSKNLWIEYDFVANSYTITYNLNGGTNNSANPSSYNIHYGVSLKNPTRPGYTFTGWTAKTASQTVTLPTNSSNYHYRAILRNLVPGTDYTLNISSASVTSGSASVFTVKIYDFTDDKTLTTQDISFGSNVSATMTCPASVDPTHDIQMIIYSGKTGSTANIATSFSGLTVSYATTGINEGEDLEFVRTDTSKDTFYSEMDARQTGSLTLTANWSENRLIVNYYSNYATKSCSDSLNTVGANKNVHVKTINYYYDRVYNVSLQDYTYETGSCYLYRAGYTGTGYWGTSTSGGTLISQETSFTTGQDLAELFGKTLVNGDVTINIYPQWTPNTLTINYYSNYATSSFSGALNTVSGSTNVLVRTWVINYSQGTATTWSDSLHDYSQSSSATYLARTGYNATGYWNTAANGTGYSVNQSTEFTSAQALAQALGVDLTTGSKTVNVYAQWQSSTYSNNIAHWAGGFKNGEGNNSNGTLFQIGTTTFNGGAAGTTVTLGADKAIALPNGFYLGSNWGTSSITGSWQDKAMGSSFTQLAKQMNFQFNYFPTNYTITYNMNGGTNNSANPSTYNVLYGVTLQTPTKTGYTFAGWYINNTQVTGINPGKDCSFITSSTTSAAFYNEMATRTTGNVTVEARWTPNTYTITCNKQSGSGGTSAFFEIYGTRFYTTSSTTGVTSISVPTRSGYVFGGYYTSTNGGGTQIVDANGNIKVSNTYFTANTTIYAKWTTASYTVTWVNYDGTVLETDTNVAAGTTPTYNGATPTRASTVYYTYTFSGWSPAISPVTGNVTYTAQFTEAIRTYMQRIYVRYQNVDGTWGNYSSVLSESYPYGWSVDGWSRAEDSTYEAASLDGYTVTSANVKYVDVQRKTYDVVLTKGTGISAVSGGGTYYAGAQVTISATVSNGYGWKNWTETSDGTLVTAVNSYSFAIYEDTAYTANASSNTYRQLVYVRYQNVDGTYTNYSAVIDGYYAYGETFPGWSSSANATYKAASLEGYTVTSANTKYVTVYRQQYTVTLNKGTGIASVTGAGTYYAGATVTLGATTSSNYTWYRWTQTSGGALVSTTKAYSFEIYSNEDFTANATYVAPTYTIYCDTQNGTGGTAAFFEIYGTRFYTSNSSTGITSISVPTRTGYAFGGYYTSTDGNGTQIVDSNGNILVSNTYFTANTTIYAKWTPISYTITYKYGSTTIATESYTIEDAITLRAAYSRTGYTFAGWNLTTAAGNWSPGVYDANQSFAEGRYGNITLYAIMNPKTYTITCDKEEGTGGTDVFYEIYGTRFYTTSSTTNVTAISVPTRDGYTFDGYFTGANGAGEQIIGSDGSILVSNTFFTANTTIYAKWTKNAETYTITCNKQGGSNGTSVFYEIYDTRFYTTNSGTAVTKISTPTKPGYTFDGYYTGTDGNGTQIVDEDGNILVDDSYFTSNATVYANWTPVEYTITYKYASTTIATQTYTVEDAITLRSAYTKTGYSFTGWDLPTAAGNWTAGDYSASQNIGTGKYGNITLYADLSAISYTITYKYGSTTIGTSTYTIEDAITLRGAYEKAGYTFNGWNLPSAVGNWAAGDYTASQSISTGKYGNVTLYADLSAISYTITYKYGSTTIGTQTYTIEDAITLRSAYEKTGYTFQSWNLSQAAGNWSPGSFNASQNISAGKYGNITLNAVLITKSYKITYDENGGSAVSDTTYTITNAVTLAGEPTRSGYAFKGWKLSTAVGNWSATTYSAGQNFAAGKYGDITLVAQWEKTKTYTVVYDGNGATDGTMPDSVFPVGETKNLSENKYEREGYVFDGWNTDPDGGGTHYDDQEAVKDLSTTDGDEVTLYAQWVPYKMTVVYHSNGATKIEYYGSTITDATLQTKTHIFEYGTSYPNGLLNMNNPDALNLTRTGYELTEYWLVDSASSSKKISQATGGTAEEIANAMGKTIKNGDITVHVYAEWTPTSYTITYNSNGGSAIAAQSYKITTAVTLAGEPTRAGYAFKGWKLSTAVGNWTATTYSAGQNFAAGKYGNITLVAQWEKTKTYTVVYDGNGATDGTMPDSVFPVGETKPLSENKYERDGYEFDGWNTDPDGNGTHYDDKESVKDLSTTDGDEVTLYAQWVPYKMTVIYHSNGASKIEYYGSTITDATLQTKTHVFEYGTEYPNGLLNMNNPDAMNLTRTAYELTGYWLVDSASSSKKISQNTGGTAEEIANAMGKTIKNGDITVHVYAEWTPVSYTITYDSNGGSAVAAQSYKVTSDVTLAAAPTKTGYDFAGWKLSAAAGNWSTGTYSAKQNVGTGKYGNITLVAQWTPRYDVALTEILLSYSTAANALGESECESIAAGEVVNVYFVITNHSLEDVNVTAYNSSGTAISYNGSTSYTVPGNNGTLTIPAGSFVASTPGAGNITGSVYLTGYTDASPETDDGTNNVNETSYAVKFDLAVKEIYLTDAEGNRLNAGAVPMDTQITVHVVYENLSKTAFTVNGYYNGSKISYGGSQNFSIPANSTIDVAVATLTTPSDVGSFSVSASVYRNGKTNATEKDEVSLANNVKSLSYNVVDDTIPPSLEPIDPGAAYRESTDVITSFWLHNTGNVNYTTSNKITVRLRMYDVASGTVIAEMTQGVVVPAGESQLVYFKWTVPESLAGNQVKSVAELLLPGSSEYMGEVTYTYDAVDYTVCYTPDTDYEEKQPDYWQKPSKPSVVSGAKTWYQWVYKNGSFEKKEYGVSVKAGASVLTPTSVTAYQKDGVWYMKSGYAFKVISGLPTITALSGYEMPDAGAYTSSQYVYVAYPEFGYSAAESYLDSMELVNGIWQLYEFENYGRVHYTPIWYPDGMYYAQVTQSDIWTPMGMVTVSGASVGIVIEGDMYDDWYTN